MPWSHRIDTRLGVIFTEATGVLTNEDLKAGAAKLFGDPDFQSDFRLFGDYTGVTELKLDAANLALLASRLPFLPKARRAFLVNDPTIAGTTHFYRANTPRGNLRIFYYRSEALAWLNEGMDPDKRLT